MKVVLHCDMNNYFASVECIGKPELKKLPVAVCGDPALRHGIVLAKNDTAKKYGIITGESSFAAKKKCAELVILKPDYTKYLKYAKLARQIYLDYCDKIYPYGMDEAWIDMSGICANCGDGVKIADEIRFRIKKELGLTASVGVSFNYVFSKLASDMKKPDATTMIDYISYKDSVWNMPAFDLLFVGNATRKTLYKMGILSIGDLAKYDPQLLMKKLGKKGLMLWRFANGDDSSFNPCSNREEDVKSLGNTITPPKDIENLSDAAAFLYVLSCMVSKRLKKHKFKASCVSVVIRMSDFTLKTRQKSFYHATDEIKTIFGYSYDLFRSNHNWDLNIRSIGIKAEKLSGILNEQLSLFDICGQNVPYDTEILELIEEIKDKYGDPANNPALEQSPMLIGV